MLVDDFKTLNDNSVYLNQLLNSKLFKDIFEFNYWIELQEEEMIDELSEFFDIKRFSFKNYKPEKIVKR